MKFSVIYSVDVPQSESIVAFLPRQRKRFTLTEGDDQYEYSYLEGDWTKGKHRKLCAVLTKAQFERFLRDTGLYPEDVQSMGSIGAPGCGFWAPAISFNSDADLAIQNAYVTPLPDVERKGGFSERDWTRIKTAILRIYR